MVKTAIKRRKDIGDLINGHALVILDENLEMKTEGESVLDGLVIAYKKIEQDFKNKKLVERDNLFNDLANLVISPCDIFKFSDALTSYLSELVINTFLFDNVIKILVQRSYNAGNNGFTLATNKIEVNNYHNNQRYSSFQLLKCRIKNPLQITFEGNIGPLDNRSIPADIFLSSSSYLDVKINGSLSNYAFHNLRSSKVRVNGTSYTNRLAENASDSAFEFYGTVLGAGHLGEYSKNCKFVFHEDVLNLNIGSYDSNASTFTFYKSVLKTEINGTNLILKTNNEKTLNELLQILFKAEDNKNKYYKHGKYADKSSNNKIYFIDADGTERLVYYVNDKSNVVKNR